jgi:hypothetical protein
MLGKGEHAHCDDGCTDNARTSGKQCPHDNDSNAKPPRPLAE